MTRQKESLWIKLAALILLLVNVCLVIAFLRLRSANQQEQPQMQDRTVDENLDRLQEKVEAQREVHRMNERLEGTGIRAIYIDPDSPPAREWIRKVREPMEGAEIDVQGHTVKLQITYLGESRTPYYETGEEVWGYCFHYEVTYEAPSPEGLEYGVNATHYALKDFMCEYDKEHFTREYARGPRLGTFWGRGTEGSTHTDEYAVEYFKQ